MENNQIKALINSLKIINDCNIERIYFLKEHILSKIYIIAWQEIRLVNNLLSKNEVTNEFNRFDLYETILLNINQNALEPNFIFETINKKEYVTTKYITKIPKYQKEYLLLKFQNSENIKLLNFNKELFFEIIPITDKLQNQDILFLKELEEKRKHIKELIDEIRFKRNNGN